MGCVGIGKPQCVHLRMRCEEGQESEKYGDALIYRLSEDLQREFPTSKGYSYRNLHYMKNMYLTFIQIHKNLPQPVAESTNTNLPQPVADLYVIYCLRTAETILICDILTMLTNKNNLHYANCSYFDNCVR